MTQLVEIFKGLNSRLRKLIIFYYGLYLGTLYCVLFYLITNIILKRQPHVEVYWQEAIHEFVVTYMGLFVLAWLSILAGAITTWIFTRPEPKAIKYSLRVTAIVLPLAIYFSSSTLVNIALKIIRVISA
ncbi:hypothetical protein [Candidatus Ponderosibacter sp. Uisw_141_02]|uniref:hypothetical protein n=1 Tax=Candidatus Ponderosibacter sp. Uisw_141_02 TaxID=3231000 RepID=UPI003D4DA289